MITDNNTAIGFANNTIKQAKSKSWDMNTNWLKCRQTQHQFQFRWEEGKTNLADYPTKHHPAQHHRALRPIFTYVKGKSPRTLARVYQILTNLSAGQKRTTVLPATQSSTSSWVSTIRDLLSQYQYRYTIVIIFPDRTNSNSVDSHNDRTTSFNIR